MQGMFSSASSFNQDISNWDVSKLVNMSRIFSHSKFNQPIGKWNTKNLQKINNIFYGIYVSTSE